MSDKNINNFINKPFGFFSKSSAKASAEPLQKTYFKADGTKVVEQKNDYGVSVTETSKDGTVIARLYDRKEVLRQDYIRQTNIEIVHHYDETSTMTDELTNYYNEHNKLVKQTEKVFEYYDNGVKSMEEVLKLPEDIKTTTKFDQQGNQIEKFKLKGTVKTFYDLNDTPIRREIDRGSGGVIVEDLTKQ